MILTPVIMLCCRKRKRETEENEHDKRARHRRETVASAVQKQLLQWSVALQNAPGGAECSEWIAKQASRCDLSLVGPVKGHDMLRDSCGGSSDVALRVAYASKTKAFTVLF